MAEIPVGASSSDHELATELAREAGAALLRLRTALDRPGADPDVVRNDGDLSSHDLLAARLAERVPDDAVLSEERRDGQDDATRLAASRVWIIDPLDGTREFGEAGRTDWAVHVALTIDGGPVAGAVALPALGLTLASRPAPPPVPPMPARPRLVVSRSRPPAAATFLAERLDAELIEMGSAGAKAMAVVRGEADAYVHSGGQYEWDSCAPVAVARAAGLHTSRLDGGLLVYNNPDPYLPDLVICRTELAEQVLELLVAFGG